MDNKKIIEKLETDLSHFLISEIPRVRVDRSVLERQTYLYKGLNIYLPSKPESLEKCVSVRIGALEAQYSLETLKKVSGSLMPDDDHSVRIWLSRRGIAQTIKSLYKEEDEFSKSEIMPFDLEDFYRNL